MCRASVIVSSIARPRASRGLQQVLWKLQARWLFACSHHQRYPGKSCCGPSTVPVAVGSASGQHKQSKVPCSSTSQHGPTNCFHPQHKHLPAAQHHLLICRPLVPNIWKVRVAARKFGCWFREAWHGKREK